MKKNIVTIIIVLTLHSIVANAQQRKANNTSQQTGAFNKKNILVGGGLGIGSGYGSLSLNMEPTLLYKVTPNFHAGVLLSTLFYKENVPYTDLFKQQKIYKYKAVDYSVGAIARYIVGYNFCLQVQPEINNYKHLKNLYYNTAGTGLIEDAYRVTTPAFLVGIGYIQGDAHNEAYYSTSMMYDVVQNPNSPYYQQLSVKVGLYFPLFIK